jgi:hypothetical protein
MFRDRLELRGLAAPDGVALLRERDQEFESGSLQRRVSCELDCEAIVGTNQAICIASKTRSTPRPLVNSAIFAATSSRL